MHQIIPIEVGMGTEKNYILLVGKKCVLELVTYLTTYLLLPSQKKWWSKLVASLPLKIFRLLMMLIFAAKLMAVLLRSLGVFFSSFHL